MFLPAPVEVDKMTAEGYTGAQGSKEQAYRAEILEPGHAHWEVTRVLQPSEGFTIVLSFPKGLIAAPSGVQRILWLLQDNRGLLIAVIGLILLIVYCVREWSRVGRDPRRGVDRRVRLRVPGLERGGERVEPVLAAAAAPSG